MRFPERSEQIPNLSLLRFPRKPLEHEEEETEVFGGVVLAAGERAHGLLQQAYSLWQPLQPQPHQCDDNPPARITSALWQSRQFDIENEIRKWDHIESQDEILQFFETASKEESPHTLAHVVLTKKKMMGKDGQPEECRGPDACQHGHLAVVFQPLYAEEKTTGVVSVGFFPKEGNAWNMLPMFLDEGNVQIPDPMVAKWQENLAIRDADSEEAEKEDATDYIKVIKTFTISSERMKVWRDMLANNKSDEDASTNFYLEAPNFSMYAGVGLTGMLIGHLGNKMADLKKDLAVISDAYKFKPLNCAVFVKAAFPEANIECPLGIPAACYNPDADPNGGFSTLSDGLAEMIFKADATSKEAKARYEAYTREILTRNPANFAARFR